MKTQCQRFVVRDGEVISEGKSTWPAHLSLQIPRDEVFPLAMQLLRSLEHPRPDASEFLDVPLFGRFEPMDGNHE
jgi:hypothetical protein